MKRKNLSVFSPFSSLMTQRNKMKHSQFGFIQYFLILIDALTCKSVEWF